ncbi:hypothetical protein BGP_1130 [Beggiatoa sp. PS]|nr:hypothetical protein BGP_1130 [Beggiatoa sp. PS]
MRAIKNVEQNQIKSSKRNFGFQTSGMAESNLGKSFGETFV